MTFVLLACTAANGAIVTWWRFEEDLDPSESGVLVTNEVTGEPDLTSGNGTLVFGSENVFSGTLPSVGLANSGSIRALTTGGSSGIFATAPYSPNLDVSSLTAEFWIRTTESTAGFLSRTTNPDNSGEDSLITDGFSILDPNSVRVDFYTSRLDGSTPALVSLNSNLAVNDGAWHYIGFRYDAVTTRAELIIDNQTVSTILSTEQELPIWWGADGSQPGVMVGFQLDGNEGNTLGILDEVRISEGFVPNAELIPEADFIVLAFAALAAGALKRLSTSWGRTNTRG